MHSCSNYASTTWKFRARTMADDTTVLAVDSFSNSEINNIADKEMEDASSENQVKIEEEESQKDHQETATPSHDMQAETEEGGVSDNAIEEALGVSASDLNMTTSSNVPGVEQLSKITEETSSKSEQEGKLHVCISSLYIHIISLI